MHGDRLSARVGSSESFGKPSSKGPLRSDPDGEKRDAEWFLNHRSVLDPHVLRTVDPPDELLPLFLDSGQIVDRASDAARRQILITFEPFGKPPRGAEVDKEIPLHHFAAASIALQELVGHVVAAHIPLGIEVSPSCVNVKPGSIDLAVGGGLLASGVALIVACAGEMIAAPIVGPLAGSRLTLVGAIDLILSWKESAARIRLANADARRGELENQAFLSEQAEAERQLELDLKRLEVAARAHEVRQAAPALVPRELVRSEAERLHLDESHATHILNRGLRAFHQVQTRFSRVRLEED